ncbi:hypothetical protein JAAARDRAFT_193817 [Jaapia argillacea MUCL 33604]|uniref:Uncharacterized protein n=1 Tax=Jaapia argillacea MUCL 33604 TaxID=933084 RepID=A0A067PRQ4_9AGAM|nr:hypothetical protein JAAARDRAFT_193817 [Jaapia argillacea MUCL 33604]
MMFTTTTFFGSLFSSVRMICSSLLSLLCVRPKESSLHLQATASTPSQCSASPSTPVTTVPTPASAASLIGLIAATNVGSPSLSTVATVSQQSATPSNSVVEAAKQRAIQDDFEANLPYVSPSLPPTPADIFTPIPKRVKRSLRRNPSFPIPKPNVVRTAKTVTPPKVPSARSPPTNVNIIQHPALTKLHIGQNTQKTVYSPNSPPSPTLSTSSSSSCSTTSTASPTTPRNLSFDLPPSAIRSNIPHTRTKKSSRLSLTYNAEDDDDKIRSILAAFPKVPGTTDLESSRLAGGPIGRQNTMYKNLGQNEVKRVKKVDALHPLLLPMVVETRREGIDLELGLPRE